MGGEGKEGGEGWREEIDRKPGSQQTCRQAHGRINRQAGRQTGGQSDRQIDRSTSCLLLLAMSPLQELSVIIIIIIIMKSLFEEKKVTSALIFSTVAECGQLKPGSI